MALNQNMKCLNQPLKIVESACEQGPVTDSFDSQNWSRLLYYLTPSQ